MESNSAASRTFSSNVNSSNTLSQSKDFNQNLLARHGGFNGSSENLMRGVNNNKGSPESGWSFPMMNAQMMTCFSPQHAASFMAANNLPSKNFASSTDYRASVNFFRENMFRNMLSSSAMPLQKMVNPFCDFPFRQQQLFESTSNNQNLAGSLNTMFGQKPFSLNLNINNSPFIRQPNSNVNDMQLPRFNTPLLTPTGHLPSPMAMNNLRLPKNSMGNENQGHVSKNLYSFSNYVETNPFNLKITSGGGTPGSEMRSFQESLMQSYLHFKPSVPLQDVRHFNTLMQPSPITNFPPSVDLSKPKSCTENQDVNTERKRCTSLSTTTSLSPQHDHQDGVEQHDDGRKPIGEEQNAHFQVSTVCSVDQVPKPHGLITTANSIVNNFGDVKSTEARIQQAPSAVPPFTFDPRIYQAVSTVSSASGSNSVTTETSKIETGTSQPQRPNHLGSNFIPQTHFLSINVQHGTTPGSDKDSVLSSNNSSTHHSPYSTSTYQTPSPNSSTSDKLKEKTDFTCGECNKSFSSASSLAKHKLVHSDERKYVCHICQKGFKRQDHLTPTNCTKCDRCAKGSLKKATSQQSNTSSDSLIFKQQNQLLSDKNGHMTTHSDKKPHGCQVQDCGRSFSDARSLRKHLDSQHHNSPMSGATPSSYMPKLYPEQMMASMSYYNQKDNRLCVTVDPPRPSSVPLAPPEPKRVARKRRSSSGEEIGAQLDPTMIRELEARKMKDSYSAPVSERIPHLPHVYSPNSQGLLVTSTTSTGKSYENRIYEHNVEQRYMSEYDKLHRGEHRREISETGRINPQHKDAEDRKRGYSPSGQSTSYNPGVVPPVINPHYLWAQYGPPKTTSGPNTNMPYLMNIRNSANIGSHNLFPPHLTPTNESSDSKEVSTKEHQIRQQGMNLYLQMWANGQRGSLTPEQLAQYQKQLAQSSQGPSTPTDPAAIAIAAAKEHVQRPHNMYSFGKDFYGAHPAMTQWQTTVMHEEISRANEKDSKPYYPSSISNHPNNNNDPSYMKPSPNRESVLPTPLDRVIKVERNIVDEPFKPSENNHKDRYMYNASPHRHFYDRGNRPPVIGHHSALHELSAQYDKAGKGTLLEPMRTIEPPRSLDIARSSPSRYDQITSTPQRQITPAVYIEQPEDRRSVSPGRKRPRPDPLIIPPAVNNRTLPNSLSPSKALQPFPKSIYTPPAMLSPKSVFFNPPAPAPRTNPPATPARFLLNIRRSTSIDQREASNSVSSEEQLQISTDVPEPKINVGSTFQATLPDIMDRSEAQKDIHRASLMWAPIKEDDVKSEEINAYLDMACSLALYGGSNNKEYALHILQRTRGNVKEAVRLLLSRRHILRADDPNADYHYSGSVRWTAKERLAFRQAYRTKGKLFSAIQKEVSTKSVQLCVEFYYLWKAMHPESFRARTRMVEVESEQDDEEVPPTPTAAVAPLSTLREPVFECDYPECRARFVSRQALNGHIRVHGGSLSKPAEPRRPKQKNVIIMSSVPEQIAGEMSPPKKKKTTASSVIVTNTPDGPQNQFQCKVCGRVFNKVKSRSAHMKTHVKRDDNNKPIKLSKQQKLQQQQQKRAQQQQQQHVMPQPPHLPQGPPHLPPLPHHQHPQSQPPPPSSINPLTLYAHA